MVAGRLLAHGMHPAGLWRSLNLPMAIERVPDSAAGAGVSQRDSAA